jgi:phosphatidylserine/phosphatidylglycerophosphate/cardiolipin synthase-like enzyme
MHMKVSIIDDNVATTGSFNYTLSAQDKNDENFVVINNSQIAQTYETEFESMWNDTSNFEDWS